MSFADRLKEARLNMGMTQKQLADKINVGNTAVSNYEKGSSFPNIDVLYLIFEALNIDPNFLFQDEVKIDNKRGALSSREIVLLNKYSKLHSIDQTKVDTYIDDLLENRKYTEKITEMPREKYYQVAADRADETEMTLPPESEQTT